MGLLQTIIGHVSLFYSQLDKLLNKSPRVMTLKGACSRFIQIAHHWQILKREVGPSAPDKRHSVKRI